MNSHLRNEFFLIVKFIGILFLIVSGLFSFGSSIDNTSLFATISALFLLLAVAVEFMEHISTKNKFYIALGEGILSVWIVFLFPVTGILCLILAYMDVLYLFRINKYSYFSAYVFLVLCPFCNVGFWIVFFASTFIICMYYQEKVVIRHLHKMIQENEKVENRLKTDMRQSDRKHENELVRSRLKYENMLLEEKGQISQALHDKLGHSINGSLYKLEASKLLVDKKPEDSKAMLQDVIDNLRGSMDEIRAILRRERPDKKKTSVLALQKLCDECESEYGIKAALTMNESDKTVPEKIWEIILDNTFEAVTNALKYSKCKTIRININVMNQVVRCTIADDGVGASSYKEGMGLEGMKKRVRDAKGYLDIESDAGFVINMLLPIE